jgi:hypothetical protein
LPPCDQANKARRWEAGVLVRIQGGVWNQQKPMAKVTKVRFPRIYEDLQIATHDWFIDDTQAIHVELA